MSSAWQFAGRDPEAREKVALRIIAFSFFALDADVPADAIRALLGIGEAPTLTDWHHPCGGSSRGSGAQQPVRLGLGRSDRGSEDRGPRGEGGHRRRERPNLLPRAGYSGIRHAPARLLLLRRLALGAAVWIKHGAQCDQRILLRAVIDVHPAPF